MEMRCLPEISRTWIEGELASTKELWQLEVADWEHGGCESTEGICDQSK